MAYSLFAARTRILHRRIVINRLTMMLCLLDLGVAPCYASHTNINNLFRSLLHMNFFFFSMLKKGESTHRRYRNDRSGWENENEGRARGGIADIYSNKAQIVGLMTWFQYKYINHDWNMACCARYHSRLSTFVIFFFFFISHLSPTLCLYLLYMRVQTDGVLCVFFFLLLLCLYMYVAGMQENPIKMMDFIRSKCNFVMERKERFDSSDAFPVKWAQNNHKLIMNTRRILYGNS